MRSRADAPRRPKIQGARIQTSVQPMIPVAEPGVGVELHRDPDSRSTAQVYEEQDMDGACLGSVATGVSPHPQRLGGVHEEAVRHAPEGSQTNNLWDCGECGEVPFAGPLRRELRFIANATWKGSGSSQTPRRMASRKASSKLRTLLPLPRASRGWSGIFRLKPGRGSITFSHALSQQHGRTA